MCVDGFWGKGEQFGARAEEENVAVAGDRCLGIGRGLDERKDEGREERKSRWERWPSLEHSLVVVIISICNHHHHHHREKRVIRNAKCFIQSKLTASLAAFPF